MPTVTQANSLITYKANAGDNFANVAAAYNYTCSGITAASLASYNNLAVTTTFTAGQVILVPCNRRAGLIDCGCAPSLIVCSLQDNRNYASFCDAQCNYALPVTTGSCATCAVNCIGRAGLVPTTWVSGCPSICPYPQWGPDVTDITAIVDAASSPRCTYVSTTCENVCNDVYVSTGYSTTALNNCNSACLCCSRLPCGFGTCTATSTWCTDGSGKGVYSGGVCKVNCNNAAFYAATPYP